ncbi:hypothetical protein [Anaerotardibacter muris]|uniref:hypothetical protein n=1 Tax=Anaerotardibacter muris TaxID=2941505 RepID=UPI0020418BD7|nr:hypothetical protein [Anaerotardibacter muris]
MMGSQGKLLGQIVKAKAKAKAKAMVEAKSRSMRLEQMTRGHKLLIETIEDV